LSKKITIGLPVYNEQKFIAETLDGFISQTYTEFELVISDNCSSDETSAICLRYAMRDSRISYHRQVRNIGSTDNFLFVLEKADSEYFAWAGGHDVPHPSFIQECLQILEEDPKVNLCYPQFRWVDKRGRLGKLVDRDVDTRGLMPKLRFQVILWNTTHCHYFQGVWRTEVLKKTPLSRSPFGPDHLLLVEQSLLGEFALVRKPLINFRKLDDYGDLPHYFAKILGKRGTSVPVLMIKSGAVWLSRLLQQFTTLPGKIWAAPIIVAFLLLKCRHALFNPHRPSL
jgi:glycosyltransferase involved in cell wall biosynthesis